MITWKLLYPFYKKNDDDDFSIKNVLNYIYKKILVFFHFLGKIENKVSMGWI